ncbi:hypothetical protein B7486_56655 [cyanobacterium TDX16]|nr:hypothetical protein B7486_56655 [cyanobacterium TDX16]
MAYPMTVARRQVLVQLDDDLVERLDRLAEAQGTNRSALLRRGAAAVLDAAQADEQHRRMVEGYRRHPQDPELIDALSRIAAETVPEW